MPAMGDGARNSRFSMSLLPRLGGRQAGFICCYIYCWGWWHIALSTTSTVKSTIGYSRKDSYSKLFRKNIFVTAKKLRFYNGKKLAFTVPKGKQVTLKKLTLSKGNIYLQFQYGKKTGWISVNNKNYDFESPYFKKVNSRLAG